MQFITFAVAVMATLAAAAPSCEPGTYSCAADGKSWTTCDTKGTWKVGYSTFILERSRLSGVVSLTNMGSTIALGRLQP